MSVSDAAATASDDEPAGGEEQYEEDNDDFLVGFPDETDVSGAPPKQPCDPLTAFHSIRIWNSCTCALVRLPICVCRDSQTTSSVSVSVRT